MTNRYENILGTISNTPVVKLNKIGPAANQAARVEALCKELEQTILVSDTLVSDTEMTWRSLGHHELRGVERSFEIFGPMS